MPDSPLLAEREALCVPLTPKERDAIQRLLIVGLDQKRWSSRGWRSRLGTTPEVRVW